MSEAFEIIDPRDWPGGAPRHPALLPRSDIDDLLSRLKKGVPVDDACWSIGLNPSRFNKWMKEPIKPRPDDHPSIAEFRFAVRRTIALGVSELVEFVHDCEPSEVEHPSITSKRIDLRWKLLERMRPDQFSQRAIPSRVEVDVSHRIIDQREGQQIVSILQDAGLQIPDEIQRTLGVEAVDDDE